MTLALQIDGQPGNEEIPEVVVGEECGKGMWGVVFFQAEDGIRDYKVTGVQTCALPISWGGGARIGHHACMPTPRRPRRLWDAYRFPGFGPSSTVVGIFGDPHARVLALHRRSKKRPAEPAGASSAGGTTASGAAFATSAAATCGSTSRSRSGAWPAGVVAR